jgi:CelD/BcsL family acetyltransferase involved in cellulose biosynthesis
MSASRVVQFDSPAALRATTPAWDDLWRRSAVAMPIARAEPIAQYVEQFGPSDAIHALAVESDGQLVAALPLVAGRVMRLAQALTLPANPLTWAGDLLLDSAAGDEVLTALVGAIRRLPQAVLWLDGVTLDAPHWRRFLAALEAADLPHVCRESFRAGQVTISHDWDALCGAWSANHRRHLKQMERRAEKDGGVELVVYRDLSADACETLVRQGFAIEDRSWKGAAGTSVLKTPGILEYYVRQAREMAAAGQLQLSFLVFRGQPIAFEYGWNAKGVYFSPKVGYDEAFAQLTPGQMLRYRLLERFSADPEQTTFDFCGPLCDATRKWITGSYPISRMVASTGRLSGRLFLQAYRLRRAKAKMAALV